MPATTPGTTSGGARWRPIRPPGRVSAVNAGPSSRSGSRALGDEPGQRAVAGRVPEPREAGREHAQPLRGAERRDVARDDPRAGGAAEPCAPQPPVGLLDGAGLLPGGTHQRLLVVAHDPRARAPPRHGGDGPC